MRSAAFDAATPAAPARTPVRRPAGRGRALDPAVRARMAAAFGTDFGAVRVHTDAPSDAFNRDVSAEASTLGEHLYFRAGAYRPGTGAGMRLLAHELTHVVQQRGASGGSAPRLGPIGGTAEAQAEAAAARVAAGGDVDAGSLDPVASGTVQRRYLDAAGPAAAIGNFKADTSHQKKGKKAGRGKLRAVDRLLGTAMKLAPAANAWSNALDSLDTALSRTKYATGAKPSTTFALRKDAVGRLRKEIAQQRAPVVRAPAALVVHQPPVLDDEPAADVVADQPPAVVDQPPVVHEPAAVDEPPVLHEPPVVHEPAPVQEVPEPVVDEPVPQPVPEPVVHEPVPQPVPQPAVHEPAPDVVHDPVSEPDPSPVQVPAQVPARPKASDAARVDVSLQDIAAMTPAQWLASIGLPRAFFAEASDQEMSALHEISILIKDNQLKAAQGVIDALCEPVVDDQGGRPPFGWAPERYKSVSAVVYDFQRTNDRMLGAVRQLLAYHAPDIGGLFGQLMSYKPFTAKYGTKMSRDEENESTRYFTENELRNWEAKIVTGGSGGLPLEDLSTKIAPRVAREYTEASRERGKNDPDYDKPAKGVLEYKEIAALRIYTADQYQELNAVFRDYRVDIDDPTANWKKYSAIARLAINALGKLPKARGTTSYRGDNDMKFSGYSLVLRMGATFRLPCFYGTTESAYNAFEGELGYVFHNKRRARHIWEFSAYVSEQEILIPPGTPFRVVAEYNKDDSGQWLSHDGSPVQLTGAAELLENQGKQKRKRIVELEEIV